MICILMQYRGCVGFPVDESHEDDFKGNYSILDQRLAIGWINANPGRALLNP